MITKTNWEKKEEENAGNRHFDFFSRHRQCTLISTPKDSVSFNTLHFLLLVVSCYLTVFQLYRVSKCSYPSFPGVLSSSTPHNIPTKPLQNYSNRNL